MTKTLNVEGMSCNHCAGAVAKALEKLDGVTKATVDLKKKTVIVEISNDKVTDKMLRDAVENAGYELK